MATFAKSDADFPKSNLTRIVPAPDRGHFFVKGLLSVYSISYDAMMEVLKHDDQLRNGERYAKRVIPAALPIVKEAYLCEDAGVTRGMFADYHNGVLTEGRELTDLRELVTAWREFTPTVKMAAKVSDREMELEREVKLLRHYVDGDMKKRARGKQEFERRENKRQRDEEDEQRDAREAKRQAIIDALQPADDPLPFPPAADAPPAAASQGAGDRMDLDGAAGVQPTPDPAATPIPSTSGTSNGPSASAVRPKRAPGSGSSSATRKAAPAS